MHARALVAFGLDGCSWRSGLPFSICVYNCAAKVHWCSGCCTSLEQARDNVCNAIIESNLILGLDIALPSKNRWGSTGEALADEVAGWLFAGILPRTYLRAHPHRRDDQVEAAQAAQDDFRELIRGKVWKSKMHFMRDNVVIMESAIVLWTRCLSCHAHPSVRLSVCTALAFALRSHLGCPGCPCL